jgi:hypothetical protein
MEDTQWIFNIINLPQIDKFASPTCVYPYPDLNIFKTYIYIYTHTHTYLAEIILKSDILNPDIPIANIGTSNHIFVSTFQQTMLKQKCDSKLLMKFP